jgi:hypothetical protein
MTELSRVERTADPNALRRRITCALLFFAARHVPVPFLDDILRTQISTYLVRRTVSKAGLAVSNERLAPLCAKDESFLMGCLMALLRIPLKLILFPIRAFTNVLFLVRHVGRDFAEMFLLIRSGEAEDAPQIARSQQMRRAFDRALKETDTQLLWGMVSVAVGPIRGLFPAARRALRTLWSGSEDEALEKSTEMQTQVSAVERALLQPEVKRFLAEFDQRYEMALRDEAAPKA